MADTSANFIADHTSGQEVTQKSTVSNGVHTPHVIAEPASNDPHLTAYTDWILGDDTSAFTLSSGATLTSAPIDLTRVRRDHATLVLQISSKSGTIDVDVDMLASEDGVNNVFTIDEIISNKTANGSYTLALDHALFVYNHFPKFQIVENAAAGGSCSVKLYLMARGG